MLAKAMQEGSFLHRWGLLIIFSLAYGACMVSLNADAGIFSPSPYHRLQADALLHGHLYLSDSILDLKPGLAWHDGYVQQVWGLGVGIWLIPFQGISHLLGFSAFPERISMAIAFALLAFYCGSTTRRIVKQRADFKGIGMFMWLTLLCPALWTLSRGPQLIFEETVIYAILLSLAILVALIRFASFDSILDFYGCCGLGAFSGFVRPTHAIYGLAGILACMTILFLRRRGLRDAILGFLIVVSGFCLLALTNWIRFGSPVEFGHNLTVTNGELVYLTRFNNPFLDVGVIDAVKELFSMLFLSASVRQGDVFAEHMFPFQSSAVRWRALYSSTFDLSYVILCVAVVAMGLRHFIAWPRKIIEHRESPENMLQRLALSLLTWALVAILGLGVFYLYFPTITSRYLLDFAPAFMGFVLLAGIFLAQRWPGATGIVLGIWLLFEIGNGRIAGGNPNVLNPVQEPVSLRNSVTEDLNNLDGAYTNAAIPSTLGIAFNGNGWDPISGTAESVVMVAIDKPRFVDLFVSSRLPQESPKGDQDFYQAKIDNQFLPVRSVTTENGKVHVVFAVPERIARRKGIEYLFLCFTKGYEVDNRRSKRMIYCIRWR